MDKNEFIKNACSMGYCSRVQAEMYCADRESFTEDDYIGVYQSVQERKVVHNRGYPLYGGGKTTKFYFREEGDLSDD